VIAADLQTDATGRPDGGSALATEKSYGSRRFPQRHLEVRVEGPNEPRESL
jgi:hypothetical protein